jgi:PilZ domain
VEQREHQRVRTSIPIEWGVSDAYQRRGTILSLSTGGCLIKANIDELLSDKTIFVRFMLPAGHWSAHWVSLRGEIAYYLRGVGFAMQFTEMTEADSEMLGQLVLYYREMGDFPEIPRPRPSMT